MVEALEKPEVLIDQKTAELVAIQTSMQLSERGYCYWRCAFGSSADSMITLKTGITVAAFTMVPPASCWRSARAKIW